MPLSTILGSIGVATLLVAFFLNLFKMLSQESTTYLLLNVIGGALSAYASLLIDYMPFVVLESTWCLVAIVAIVKKLRAT